MTVSTNFFRLRLLAAILITVSGIGQVTMLWFRELTGEAVIDALLGVVYIIIGIGLQGQSRFTLFMAIGVPAAAATMMLDSDPGGALNRLEIIRLSLDVTIMLCAGMVLTNTRQ